jgi:hypothetical protein
VLRNMRSVISSICRGSKAGDDRGSEDILWPSGSVEQDVESVEKPISFEVRLAGMVDDNILIESIPWAGDVPF